MFTALLRLLATISAATPLSFDLEQVGAEKRVVSREVLHKLHGEKFLAQLDKGVSILARAIK